VDSTVAWPPASLRPALLARLAVIASAVLLLAPIARPAAEPRTTPPAGGLPLADSALRVGGIFDTSLPGIERRNALRRRWGTIEEPARR
jgi:hypothetical protein